MARADIVGSWFVSGYHGNFRSKSRSDINCEYRHLARPDPPKSFILRARAHPTTHKFSNHDNRHCLKDDAMYFEQGLGKRSFKTKNAKWFNQDLLTWQPQKFEFDHAGPQKSIYGVDYRCGAKGSYGEKLVKRPKTAFDDDGMKVTSYRYAFGNQNPNRQLICASSNQPILGSTRKVKTPVQDETVASCMTWKPDRQAATRVTTLSQHVPILSQKAAHDASTKHITIEPVKTAEAVPVL